MKRNPQRNPSHLLKREDTKLHSSHWLAFISHQAFMLTINPDTFTPTITSFIDYIIAFNCIRATILHFTVIHHNNVIAIDAYAAFHCSKFRNHTITPIALNPRFHFFNIIIIIIVFIGIAIGTPLIILFILLSFLASWNVSPLLPLCRNLVRIIRGKNDFARETSFANNVFCRLFFIET